MKVNQVLEARRGYDYKTLFTRTIKTKGGAKVKINLTVLRGYGMVQGIGLELLDPEDGNKEIAKKEFYNGGFGKDKDGFHKYILYGRTGNRNLFYEKDSAVNASIKHHWEALILPCFEDKHFADMTNAFEDACKRITHAFAYESTATRGQYYGRLLSGSEHGGAWELIELSKVVAEKSSGDPKDVLMRILLNYIKSNEASLRVLPNVDRPYDQLGNRVLQTIKSLKDILKWPELDIVEKSVKALTK